MGSCEPMTLIGFVSGVLFMMLLVVIGAIVARLSQPKWVTGSKVFPPEPWPEPPKGKS